jgi:hypothetical protein
MRAFAGKLFLVLCATALVLGVIATLGVIAMLVDWKRPDPQMIDPSDLAKIQIGDVIRLRELLKVPAERVCLLTPYRDRLDETEPLADLVNARLKAMGLRLQDNGFALVIVNGDQVTVQRIGGRKPYYLAAWHEGAGRILKRLHCADADRVFVTKVVDPLWPTLVFGEER